jgi:predicted dehydrogenase
MSKVKLLLIGIGGYGNLYVDALLKRLKEYDDEKTDAAFEIAGFIDPMPEGCRSLDKLLNMGIRSYKSIEEFCSNGQKPNLTVISTPIHMHCSMTVSALLHGSDVLCEKPVSATIQEALTMIDARNETGRNVSIGYQWSHSKAVTLLKKDISDGMYGKPLKLKTLVLWPRNKQYYQRAWAAKKKAGDGSWILDSVANNATAHYLHNMFYILGREPDKSAVPIKVKSELYRANCIENFDTAAIRAITKEGVEILYFGSHATKDSYGPVFEYKFEKGVIKYNYQNDKCFYAVFNDGRDINYGNPDEEYNNKIWMAIDYTRNSIKPVCSIESSISQTLCINGAQESMPDTKQFPKEIIKFDDTSEVTWAEALFEILTDCYENEKMPYDMGVSWAESGSEINLENYRFFPSIH